MGTPSQGALTKMAIDDSTVTGISDFDSSSQGIEFISEDLRMVSTINYNNGIRGTRSRLKDRCVVTQEVITGSIVIEPTPIELDLWFPRILGAAESSDVFALAETIPEWGVLIDRIVQRHIYTNCRVSRATFTGAQSQPIRMTIEVEGSTEVLSATSFPTVGAIDTGQPYIMGQTTFSLSADASAAECLAWTIVIDNMLDTNRFLNSVTRSKLTPQDRMISLQMTVPYTADEIDLYDQGVAGAAGSLTLTNGGQSTVFSFANLKAPAETPVVSGKTEEFLTLNMVAYKSGSTNELIVTHDSAP